MASSTEQAHFPLLKSSHVELQVTARDPPQAAPTAAASAVLLLLLQRAWTVLSFIQPGWCWTAAGPAHSLLRNCATLPTPKVPFPLTQGPDCLQVRAM